MENLGKQSIIVFVNGFLNGKKISRTVYKNKNGDYFINDERCLNGKRKINCNNGVYTVDYTVKSVQMFNIKDVINNLQTGLSK